MLTNEQIEDYVKDADKYSLSEHTGLFAPYPVRLLAGHVRDLAAELKRERQRAEKAEACLRGIWVETATAFDVESKLQRIIKAVKENQE